jgi:GNAT superfamily N-acetyltransferase
VRRARSGDVAAIAAMRRALLVEHADDLIFGRLRRDATARTAAAVRAALAHEERLLLVAARGRALVGTLECGIVRNHAVLRPERVGYLSAVYVAPAARGRGLLTRMVATAERWCRAQGLDELRLHTGAHNPLSNAVWERLGFVVAEHTRLRAIA